MPTISAPGVAVQRPDPFLKLMIKQQKAAQEEAFSRCREAARGTQQFKWSDKVDGTPMATFDKDKSRIDYAFAKANVWEEHPIPPGAMRQGRLCEELRPAKAHMNLGGSFPLTTTQ
jgi:hypothetical protein